MFDFQCILDSSAEINKYFQQMAKNQNQCLQLAIQLIKQSISKRISKSTISYNQKNTPQQQKQNTTLCPNSKQHKNQHYNVSYIKHNRFLSPSQKKQITPKVTEIIPVSQSTHYIYGKPKVKLNQYTGCQVHFNHNSECMGQDNQYTNLQITNNVKPQVRNQKEHFGDRNNFKQSAEQKQNDDFKEIYHPQKQYLSPKNTVKIKKNQNINKKESNNNKKQNSITQNLKSPQRSCLKNSKQNYKSQNQIPTGQKNHKNHKNPKQNIHQQFNVRQNYINVESKIKDLIKRDKKNKQFVNQIQRQKQQIQLIEQNQNKLLLRQKQLKQQEDYLLQKSIKKAKSYDNLVIKNLMTRAQIDFQNNNTNLYSSVFSSQLSLQNDHYHDLQGSKFQCYECEIQRLRKRKQKAQKAIRKIEIQQSKRRQLLQRIAQKQYLSQLYSH